jgi:hypothetical protein
MNLVFNLYNYKDDFTGKFCCQGYFRLIRSVKSVLENHDDFMPSKSICSSCSSKGIIQTTVSIIITILN